ncbi:hypothetical protein BP5796_13251 [Coleophoma crateriformis]|uniref:Methyltransferase n=1 Tax=Coleophoma crateriformis TaxID=565419 RepID=A0A3D8Q341_9HELO|nr:hypothetical protein BP5796_13251 [Coleophoma crateriformis]
MPTLTSSIEYLQGLPLYDVEKPYWCMLTPREGFDPDKQRLDNLEFETRHGITITDIREADEKPTLAYKTETEEMLRSSMGASFVRTYEFRARKNIPISRPKMNIADPLLYEGPARGAHNDVTFDSGPVIINRYLSAEEKAMYLRPGFRFQIINTWRSLVEELEDRPLALCDSRTIEANDLIAADRIIPDRVGEVYYLKYNKNHKWYWLSKQNPDELFVFVMYDTVSGDNARFCPHVSISNTLAPANAPYRQSVETRSIVVRKI